MLSIDDVSLFPTWLEIAIWHLAGLGDVVVVYIPFPCDFAVLDPIGHLVLLLIPFV